VRNEGEMQQALENLKFWERAPQDRRLRPPRIQSRLAHRARPQASAHHFRGHHPLGLDRKESRGGHFREDFPDKSAEAPR
jgi:aspartate oxidase